MMLLSFNRRLAWLIGALLLWSLSGLVLILGLLPRHPGQHGALPFELGLKRRDLHIPGRVMELREFEGRLLVHMAPPLRRDWRQDQVPKDLPADIELTYALEAELAPGRPRIGAGLSEPQRLPGGGQMLLSTNYLLRIDRRGLTVMPRPAELRKPWGERLLRRRIEQGGEPGPGPDGRSAGEGRRPLRRGEGPPPPPPDEGEQRQPPPPQDGS